MQPSERPPADEPSARDLRRELLAERAAREQADRAVSRLSVLLQVGDRLAGVAELPAVARSIVDVVLAELDASSAVVCLLDPEARRFHLLASAGMDETQLAQWREFPLDAPLPAGDAVRERRPILLRSIPDRDARYPALRGQAAGSSVDVVLPLVVEDRGVGALALGWPAASDVTESDLPLLSAVAQQAAQALERGRLLEAERAARTEAEHAARAARTATERVALLADVGAAVSTLDPRQSLRRLVRTLLPRLADQAAAYLADDAGLHLVEVAHVRPDLQALARELATAEPQQAAQGALLDAMAAGRPRVVPHVDPAAVAAFAGTDEHRRMLGSLAVRSVAIVPLVAGERRLGVVTCGLSVSGRSYGDADVALFEELGRRAGAALDNAGAHQDLAAAARELQQSLLPGRLATVPGVEVAARYTPAGDGTAPGGDLYDVWPLEPTEGDRYAVLVADASGRGVRAAAVTASVRHTARAVSHDRPRPSDVLRRVGDAVRGLDDPEAFCTAAYLVLTPPSAPGRPALVELALGGAPQPLLRRADGSVEPVGRTGSALGLLPRPELADTVVDLRPGDLLVLHTDGYAALRRADGSVVDRLVEQTLARTATGDAPALARALERAALEAQGGRPRDDLAVLVLRVAPG